MTLNTIRQARLFQGKVLFSWLVLQISLIEESRTEPLPTIKKDRAREVLAY